jgi:hypothetical protein
VHARRAFQPPQARRRDQTPPVYKLALPAPTPDTEQV